MCLICWWVLLDWDQKAGWSKAGRGAEGKPGFQAQEGCGRQAGLGPKATRSDLLQKRSCQGASLVGGAEKASAGVMRLLTWSCAGTGDRLRFDQTRAGALPEGRWPWGAVQPCLSCCWGLQLPPTNCRLVESAARVMELNSSQLGTSRVRRRGREVSVIVHPDKCHLPDAPRVSLAHRSGLPPQHMFPADSCQMHYMSGHSAVLPRNSAIHGFADDCDNSAIFVAALRAAVTLA